MHSAYKNNQLNILLIYLLLASSIGIQNYSRPTRTFNSMLANLVKLKAKNARSGLNNHFSFFCIPRFIELIGQNQSLSETDFSYDYLSSSHCDVTLRNAMVLGATPLSIKKSPSLPAQIRCTTYRVKAMEGKAKISGKLNIDFSPIFLSQNLH